MMICDVVVGIAARLRSKSGIFVQVGDRLDVRRALLAAEGAVEVRADHAVPCVAGDLADVIDVIDHAVERHAGALRRGRPRTQFGTIIHASNAAPITAPRAISSRM